MKKYCIAFILMLWVALGPVGTAVSPAPPAMSGPPFLAISQIKITGDEFVVLRNNTGRDIADLSSYWLDGYNSNQPLGAGVTNSTQQLPFVKLAAGQTILLSSSGMSTCGAAVSAKLSVSLTDSGGFLQVIQTSQSNLGITKLPVDFVSWSSANDNVIPNAPSNTKNPRAAFYRYVGANGYSWQLADIDTSNPCQFNVANSTGPVDAGLVAAPTVVPSVKAVSVSSETIILSAANIGLAAPTISEVLPNPAPPQTDADDEFIELYNSNEKEFDLSGFILQAGTTSLRKYTFPEGTKIGPKKFTAYFSTDTGLNLSNNGSRVSLLDPNNNLLSQTDNYTAAKDGYSWVSLDGLWQWTTTPTPAAVNIVTAPEASKSSKSKSSAAAKSNTKGTKTSVNSPTVSANNPSNDKSKPPALHPLVLVGVGGAALLYALYEYRHDLANQLHRLRRYRASRRIAG